MQWVTKVPHSPQRTDLHIENFGTAKTTGKKAAIDKKIHMHFKVIDTVGDL